MSLTGEEILPSDQISKKEQDKFTFSPLGEANQNKTIEFQRIKQVEALKAVKPEENQKLESIKGLFPKKMRNTEIENKIDEIRKWEEKIKRKDLKYETKVYIYDFQQYKTIRSFADNIYTCKFNIDESEKDQSSLLKNLVKSNNRSRPRTT